MNPEDPTGIRTMGMAAFNANQPCSSCPFLEETVQAALWCTGWGIASNVKAALDGRKLAQEVEIAWRLGRQWPAQKTNPFKPNTLEHRAFVLGQGEPVSV